MKSKKMNKLRDLESQSPASKLKLCSPTTSVNNKIQSKSKPDHTNSRCTLKSNSTKRFQTNSTSSITNLKQAFQCSECRKPILKDKFLLSACDKYWHENCLKCDRCHGRLGELGSTLYLKSNMKLCRQDYLDLFGKTGICSVCDKLITATEMAMRAKYNVYHLECFACQLCNQRFCVGDRFYLCENKVVCQYDYDEHILPIQRSIYEQQQQQQIQHQEVLPIYETDSGQEKLLLLESSPMIPEVSLVQGGAQAIDNLDHQNPSDYLEGGGISMVELHQVKDKSEDNNQETGDHVTGETTSLLELQKIKPPREETV